MINMQKGRLQSGLGGVEQTLRKEQLRFLYNNNDGVATFALLPARLSLKKVSRVNVRTKYYVETHETGRLLHR